jgi:uncharacterized protein YfaS (alpha-2-macroglobulin family)
MTDTATVTITGTLQTSGGTPLANQQITFVDDKGDTIPAATTDANGNYSVKATVVAPAPNEKFTASFAGVAGSYASATASAIANVVAGTSLTINIVVS